MVAGTEVALIFTLKQFGELFIVFTSRKIVEKIDHAQDSGLVLGRVNLFRLRMRSVPIGHTNPTGTAMMEDHETAPEGHSPVDVASEGQAADLRTGGGLCQEGGRRERTSALPS
jgi:hypothetical protein